MLPINYQYELSAWIYNILLATDSRYANQLHNTGIPFFSKQFKLFTFSPLYFKPFKIYREEKRIEMLSDEASMIISFHVDQSAEHFIKGLFRQQELVLGDKISNVALQVSNIQACRRPVFTSTVRYRTYAPIVIAQNRKAAQKPALYLSPEHPAYAQIFSDNLIRKLAALQTAHPEPLDRQQDVIRLQLCSQPASKLISIKSHTAHPVKVKGFHFEFELTAPDVIHEIGYYGGFGEKNSLGFGCVKHIKSI